MHDLVRLFAVRRLGRDAEQSHAVYRRHAEHFRGVLAAADKLYRKHGDSTFAGLALFDRERPNIEAGFRWAREQSGADDRLARLCIAYPDAGAYCLILRQHPAERLAWLQAALGAAERLGDRPATARHAGNLGAIHWRRGDLGEAERMHRKSLETDEKLGRLEGMANTYGNLGVIHLTRGELDEAERMHLKSLAIHEKLGRLEAMAVVYGNLGLIHRERGELDEAERMHRKSLAINEQLGRLEGMAAQYGNLGSVQEQRGDLAGARELWTKARDLYARIGMPQMVAQVQGWIDALPDEPAS